ncbi:hypothetical protein M422DRAFT_29391 [Sphaerobolus stellatus SS14]|uniref:Uncharacterized protein n=1 Tax=Sphaerobolus stellatus (strain SS14) TaxID=990650 RepID=A0A0C9W3B4_SPHS4|nr:hypothetical protein M422DRAFT_29391 [Sphaerobolus stellatus SS14]
MPSTVTRTVTNMLRSCIRSQEISSDSASYKQKFNHSIKKGIQIIEIAEMLDYEDRAWM